MPPENQPQSDHDLLIILNANFGSFQNSHTTQMKDLNDKITQFLVLMEQKAAKSDFVHLQSSIKDHSERIKKMEEEHKTIDVKKETTINFGKFGVRTISFIVGTAVAAIAIYQFFTK